MSLGNRHWFSGFRSGLVRRYFLEFLPEFLLGFPRIVPGNSPEIPLKIILDFLSEGFSSEIPGRFDCSFGFFSVSNQGFLLLGFLKRHFSGFLPEFLLRFLQELLPVLLHVFLPQFFLGIPIVRYHGRYCFIVYCEKACNKHYFNFEYTEKQPSNQETWSLRFFQEL